MTTPEKNYTTKSPAKKPKTFKGRVLNKKRWIEKALGDRLSEADEPVVEMTAQMLVVCEDLFAQVAELNGAYITPTTKGGEAAHPVFRAWQETSKQVLNLTNRLGLNPVTRKENLAQPKAELDAEDDFEEALR